MEILVWAAQGVCVVLVASFLLLVCIPRLHTPVRAYLRPLAIHEVENGLEVVVAAQKWQSPWLTHLFTKSSHSVSVSFYASFLPMLFWLGLPELGRNLVFLMTLALYVGNAIKDLVSSPRPLGLSYGTQRLRFLGASDEEVQLNAKEYGLPSSHTLNTLCLNFMVVWYLYDRQLIATGTAALLYCLVFLWVLWIAASRLYLGLHTPVDLLAGALAGMAVLVTFIAVEGHLGSWVLSGPWAVLHAALASLVLLRLHPRPLAHTPSYQFSTSFMGAMFGIVVGVAAIAPHAHQPAVQLAQLWMGSGGRLMGSRALWALRRLCLGFGVVLLLKEGSHAVLLVLLPQLYRFFPLSIRRLWQPPVHNLAKLHPGKQQQQLQQPHNGQQHNGQHTAHESHQNGCHNGTEQAQQQQQHNGMRLRTRQGRATAAATAAAEAEAVAVAAAAAAPVNPLLADLPHNARGLPWDVDVTCRFFSYSAIGVAVAGMVPHMLEALHW